MSINKRLVSAGLVALTLAASAATTATAGAAEAGKYLPGHRGHVTVAEAGKYLPGPRNVTVAEAASVVTPDRIRRIRVVTPDRIRSTSPDRIRVGVDDSSMRIRRIR